MDFMIKELESIMFVILEEGTSTKLPDLQNKIISYSRSIISFKYIINE